MKRVIWLAASLLIIVACGPSTDPGVSSKPSASPSPAPTAATNPATATPTPTAQPRPTWPPQGFAWASFSGGSSPNLSPVVDVRVGSHPGYDRFVVQFSGPVPAYEVHLQSGTTFTQSPSGIPIRLAGTNGVLITMRQIGDWTGYSAAISFEPDFQFLRHARLIQNFEAVQQWGLGIQGEPCLRVFTLTAPSRLVVDVAAR